VHGPVLQISTNIAIVPPVKRFVVMVLEGGLGNQLFQFASGYGIATSVDAELFFDDTNLFDAEHWLPGLLGPHYRSASREQLLRLGVLYGPDRWRDKVARFGLRHAIDAGRRMRHLTARTMTPGDRTEDAGRYDERILSIDPPTQLVGYFQSDRYFSHVANQVVQQLRLPRVTLPPPMRSQPVVALHFRRGDFVRFGWQLPFSYYEHALALMGSEVPDATFLVFGDDPEFVRLATDWVARFGPANNAYDFADGALEQLVLASECDHAVIANSSFAWWGAWLGDRRAAGRPRHVIAPEDYRRKFGLDILPSNWVAVASG
jgi:hypothetical protein